MHKLLSILVLSLLAVSARAAEPAKPPLLAKAELKDVSGKKVGDVTLEQTPHGVLVTADLSGLPAGVHAMHIHDAAKCEPPFKTAGGHFNPTAKEHGMKNEKGMHAGDLPNIDVPKDGALKVQALVHEVTLAEGPTSLFGKSGTSIVIHAGVDDYQSNPAGNAGDRIACGVIEKK